jgi:hypothetical protein
MSAGKKRSSVGDAAYITCATHKQSESFPSSGLMCSDCLD